MRVCFVCQKEQRSGQGTPVKDDIVIRAIRRIKKAFGISTGNVLVVCDNCLEESKKRRQKFERSLLTFGGLGAVLGVILLIASILSGKSLIAILQSIILLVFLVVVFSLFSLLQYHPAVVIEAERKAARKVKRKR
jgi:fatty acid desaturase